MVIPGKYTENFQEILQEAKKYVLLQKKYLALDAADKLTVLLSAATTLAICLMLGGMILFFLTFALAYWIGQVTGSLPLGFMSIGIALLLSAIIVYRNRSKWIIQPIAKLMINLFITKEDNDE